MIPRRPKRDTVADCAAYLLGALIGFAIAFACFGIRDASASSAADKLAADGTLIYLWSIAVCAAVLWLSTWRERPRSWGRVFSAWLFLSAALAAAGLRTANAQIPPNAKTHRLALQIEARRLFGIDAPVARFAAQVHQESGWRPTAASRFADGLAQFTPATAEWIAGAYPADCAPADPYSERWALRCMVRYSRHLFDRVKPWPGYGSGLSACDRWAFVLSGYNGGPGWVTRDRRLALSQGLDPNRWAGNVATVSTRAAWAFEENRGYPRRILGTLEPRYLAAGWPSDGRDCSRAAP